MKKSTLNYLLVLSAIVIILLITTSAVISSCRDKPKQLEPSQPLLVQFDSITIEPKSNNWFFEVDAPDRGKIRVELSNYTDQPKTFKIMVTE